MEFYQNCFASYKGKDSAMGFVNGHIYEVVVEQKKHGCELSAYFDTTNGHDFVREKIPYASEKSLQHFWNFEGGIQ